MKEEGGGGGGAYSRGVLILHYGLGKRHLLNHRVI